MAPPASTAGGWSPLGTPVHASFPGDPGIAVRMAWSNEANHTNFFSHGIAYDTGMNLGGASTPALGAVANSASGQAVAAARGAGAGVGLAGTKATSRRRRDASWSAEEEARLEELVAEHRPGASVHSAKWQVRTIASPSPTHPTPARLQ